jgi:hypothetical protein
MLRCAAAGVSALFLPDCAGLSGSFGVSDDSFIRTAERYAGPMREYALGRFVFSMPQELPENRIYIIVVPPKPANVLETYKTASFNITETPWKTQDHRKEFEDAWKPLREEEKNSYAAKKFGAAGYAENLDASKLFNGSPAVCIAYDQQQASAPIETFIALPQGIVRFDEERAYYKTPSATEIEAPAVTLFKTYSWGKSRSDPPSSFYTRFGKLNGYAAINEKPMAAFMDTPRGYHLVFKTQIPPPPPPALAEYRKYAAQEGIGPAKPPPGYSSTVLQTRQLSLAGEQLVEDIVKIKIPTFDDYRLYFVLESPEFKGTVEHPHFRLDLTARWSERAQTMSMWNAIVGSLQSVPQALTR